MERTETKHMKLNDIKLINQGEHLALYSADYDLPDGSEKRYEFVSRAGARVNGPGSDTIMDKASFPDKHTRGVIIITFNETRDKILLMREFRPATGHTIFNHPMGMIDPGETWLNTAKRELKEETGLDIKRIINILLPAFSAPGISDQRTVTVIVEAGGDIKHSQNPMEITDPFWATREEILPLLASPACHFSVMTQATLYAWCCFNRPDSRTQVVRIELVERGIEEFVRFQRPLSTEDMKTLENCMYDANASETDTPVERAIAAFEAKTRNPGMLCPAPYLCDIKIE